MTDKTPILRNLHVVVMTLMVQCKAICVGRHSVLESKIILSLQAGMLALRREANTVKHEDFMEGIAVVAAKEELDYCA